MEEKKTPVMLDAPVMGVLLGRLGIAFDAAALAQSVVQTQAHFSADRLVEWVRAVMVRAQVKGVVPLQMGWPRFDTQRLPALIWHEDAWLVATQVEGAQVHVLDAAGVAGSLPLEQMRKTLVLWFRHHAPGQATAGQDGNLAAKLVLGAILADRRWITKVVIATVVVNLLAVASSLFSMQVYDRVVPTMAYATLTTLSAGMLLVMLMDAVLKTVRARILDSLSCSVDQRVSQNVFDHLMHVRLDKLPRSVGTLAAQVNGLESVRQFFSSSIVFGLVDLPFAVMFLGFIAVIGGKVAWVYALLLPLGLLIGWITHQRLKVLVRQQMSRSNERQGVLVDAIRGAEAIRAANAGWGFSQEWQGITHTIDAYSIQQKATHNFMSVSMGMLSSFSYVAAIVVGVLQVEAGNMTTGAMIACGILGARVLGPIAQGVQYLAQWEQVSQSLQMVNRVLGLEQERRPEQTLLSPALEERPITMTLDKLRYGYPESPILQVQLPEGLSFKSGDRVLLVGPVGCGKSTLLKLMAGLYKPTEGRIQLDGTDLWEIDPQVLTGHVGYLPQDVHLFKGTLRSNLTMTGVATDAQVSQMAKALGVDEIAANSPTGMDMPISEGGIGLSGGQRQLVALARVLVTQPRVWLLDEPTASLDPDSEAKVWAALDQFVSPQDILIVSTHKWNLAVRVANRVVVMRRGEVVKDGTPAEVFPKLFAKPSAAPTPLGAQALEMAGGSRAG